MGKETINHLPYKSIISIKLTLNFHETSPIGTTDLFVNVGSL